jgi:hypothetical protein
MRQVRRCGRRLKQGHERRANVVAGRDRLKQPGACAILQVRCDRRLNIRDMVVEEKESGRQKIGRIEASNLDALVSSAMQARWPVVPASSIQLGSKWGPEFLFGYIFLRAPRGGSSSLENA